MRTHASLRLRLPQFMQRGRIAIDPEPPARGEFSSLPESGQSPYFNSLTQSILKEDYHEISFSCFYFARVDCLWQSGVGAIRNQRHWLPAAARRRKRKFLV